MLLRQLLATLWLWDGVVHTLWFSLLINLATILILTILSIHLGQRVFFLWQNCFHVTKFLFQSIKHLFWDLKLNGTWMMLYSQGILTEVLYQQLILHFVVALSHLQYHIFITFFLSLLLAIRFAFRIRWITGNHWLNALLIISKVFLIRFWIHLLLLVAIHNTKRIALIILCCILIILLVLVLWILATFLLLLCLIHLILSHLTFLIEWLIVLAHLSCVVHLISLIAVTQPIVKVIPELFENVHITVLTIVSEVSSTILLHTPPLSCQFGIILYTIEISTLNTRVSYGALAILILLSWNIWLVLHTTVVLAIWVSVLLSTSTGSIYWHIRFYQIC